MFVNWLLTVFPREMQRGWQLVRIDTIFWTSLATVLALAALVGSDNESASAYWTGTFTLVRHLVFIGVFLVAAVRFEAALSEREDPWTEVGDVVVRRIIPTATAWLAAELLSVVAAIVAEAGAIILLRDTEALLIGSAVVRSIVFVVLLVRFSFVPFLTALHRSSDLQLHGQTDRERGGIAYRVAWPLIVSSRMTRSVRWRIGPYLVLVLYAPALAGAFGSVVQPVLSLALHLVSFTALAVLFEFYAERMRSLEGDSASA